MTLSSQQKPILISGGRVIDPSLGMDAIADVLISNGKIQAVEPNIATSPPDNAETILAKGKIVTPGFIDLHTHLRTPGQEWKEDLATGSQAAARGGFTTICAMPNTYPAQDDPAVIASVLQRAAQEATVDIRIIAAITKDRKGKTLAPMHELAQAGAIAFSDDGDPLMSSHLMRQALAYSSALELPVINHAEDKELAPKWDMNEGHVATRLGLTGIPVAAETAMIARDIDLLRLTGGKLHVPHVSAAQSLLLLRHAKDEGLNITAEATPHHIALSEEWIFGLQGEVPPVLSETAYDTNTKMAPPLRTSEDCHALQQGLEDGIIDIIATDHAPHADTDKVCTFSEAANGIIGLETAFSLLHSRTQLSLTLLIERLSTRPAQILRDTSIGSLKPGSNADIAIIDTQEKWKVNRHTLASKSSNTPLLEITMKGRVIRTIVNGKTVWNATHEATRS